MLIVELALVVIFKFWENAEKIASSVSGGFEKVFIFLMVCKKISVQSINGRLSNNPIIIFRKS